MTSGQDQIRGWKEIAAYFDRDERTVKRWEKQRALPVRRIPGAGRANVYILVADLEAWLASGASTARSRKQPPNRSRSSSNLQSSPSHQQPPPPLQPSPSAPYPAFC